MLNNAQKRSTPRSAPTRPIALRTKGRGHGPITRLVSPGDVGELIKPFVFLDAFDVDEQFGGSGFAPHPHSGIATLTVLLEGASTYADATGARGILSTGSIEWMRAGGGVWHTGDVVRGVRTRGYQLWLALPPELELAPAESQYLDSRQIEAAGPAAVLLGSYQGISSPIELPVPITYLHVRLKRGERWTYRPSADHDVAWLAVGSGALRVGDTVLERELAVFEEGNGDIDVVAQTPVDLVIGSAAKHPHPLITGYYSVHTNEAALIQGESTIAQMRRAPAVEALFTGT